MRDIVRTDQSTVPITDLHEEIVPPKLSEVCKKECLLRHHEPERCTKLCLHPEDCLASGKQKPDPSTQFQRTIGSVTCVEKKSRLYSAFDKLSVGCLSYQCGLQDRISAPSLSLGAGAWAESGYKVEGTKKLTVTQLKK